ncbi:hypothetical protein D0469_10095 [Peribacillus saganii]|uniref:Uncharacterized protein n=1 Tax=Peribacillus saganii TaxID=2303992 RepID=A0A372LNT2_9BACI|nr:hypothetical protein D0469_10095 [Peribacillus saganii]
MEACSLNILKYLFLDICPKCKKRLNTNKSNKILSLIVKSCPDEHFEKVYHPALETYVEINK